jgi:PAS domain S-box-containing protein
MTDKRRPTMLALDEAAAVLDLPAPAVEALVGSGYLVPSRVSRAGPEFPLSDLKAFVARNAENGVGGRLFNEALVAGGSATPAGSAGAGEVSSLDAEELLHALGERAEEMGRRAFRIFASVFPEAESWTLRQQAAFIEQAKGRFEAILAVTGQGADVDTALFEDLREVGASAARSRSPLPQLLVILRISRDLVVQTAIEVSEGGGRRGGPALSLLLTRILPAMDRLVDALAQGYWEAILTRQEEAQSRYRHVVERASDGIYEVDTEGRISYANAAFALIVGRRLSGLEGTELVEVLRPLDPTVTLDNLLTERPDLPLVPLVVVRADGVRRVVSVQPTARREHGVLVGFQGIVRDDTVEEDFEADRSAFAVLLRRDLRTPLATIMGLGATLESHADELTPDKAAYIGRSVRAQIERVVRLADDLSDIGQLQGRTLRLYPRPVEVRPVVDAALDSVGSGASADSADPGGPAGDAGSAGVAVEVGDGVIALADPRRLEQVIANLVDNALIHGAAPIVVKAEARGDEVHVVVADHGPGVAQDQVEALFAGRQTPTRNQRSRARGRGLGLALVRGLAEAMGGRVFYERDGEQSRFVLAVPAPVRGT